MFGISFHLYLLIHSNNESGAPIAMKVGSGETYFFEKNAQGDIVALFNNSGAEVARIGYDAYGNTLYIDNPDNLYIPFRYRGYYYDADTGFYYLQSRYYDPETGRFLNVDSVCFAASSDYNLFTYCMNNPVEYVDFNGYMVSEWDKAHLSAKEIYLLTELTKEWKRSNNSKEREKIHLKAVDIRAKYLTKGQTVDSWGYVRYAHNEINYYVTSYTYSCLLYSATVDYMISPTVISIEISQSDFYYIPYYALVNHMLASY